jgi:hypothetical protein
MKSFEKASTLVAVLILLSASLNLAGAQTQPEESMKTFFDSSVPSIKIQVNATAETKPTQNITFLLNLLGEGEVFVEHFNFSVYGFLRGQNKTLMTSISDQNFPLGTKQYQRTFSVPENIWDVAYGEISLAYTVKYPVGPGWQVMPYNITVGFTMTKIENVYLKLLEEQLINIRSTLNELNQTFHECFGKNLTLDELLSLNQTFWQVKQEYESLKGVKSELESTRTAVVFLAVVAVFFVATTAYLVLRRPKSYL